MIKANRRVQAIRGSLVLPLFAERIREPGEAAHLHMDREVLLFYMGFANHLRMGILLRRIQTLPSSQPPRKIPCILNGGNCYILCAIWVEAVPSLLRRPL